MKLQTPIKEEDEEKEKRDKA